MRTILIAIIATAIIGIPGGRAAATGVAAPIRVVAAENVYGDIAGQIGGSRVAVTSILSDPNADPHLYEPGTRNGLAVAHARLVIQNGLGYDAFMARLEAASPAKSRVVLTVADELGIHGRDANPHLWYDVPKLARIAGAIAAGLERVDPAGQSVYRSGLRRFLASCGPLRAEVRSLHARFGGASVAYTEPVPGYLLAAAGLRNLAPSSFTRAIEDGSEPSPIAVAEMSALVTGGKVKVLLYNSQAVSPITARVRAEAVSHHLPVVGVSETLPPRLSFQQWQLRQARALAAALAR
jgi:zinc/manganese transport system substrate-binding protein